MSSGPWVLVLERGDLGLPMSSGGNEVTSILSALGVRHGRLEGKRMAFRQPYPRTLSVPLSMRPIRVPYPFAYLCTYPIHVPYL